MNSIHNEEQAQLERDLGTVAIVWVLRTIGEEKFLACMERERKARCRILVCRELKDLHRDKVDATCRNENLEKRGRKPNSHKKQSLGIGRLSQANNFTV